MDVQLRRELIRDERDKRAWTQEHLAEVTGLGVRTIQRIEATGVASRESASAISSVFSIPLADLRVMTNASSRFNILIWLLTLVAFLIAAGVMYAIGLSSFGTGLGILGFFFFITAGVVFETAFWFQALFAKKGGTNSAASG